MEKLARVFFDLRARKLLILAAILQVTVVLTLFTIGRLRIAPSAINQRGVLDVGIRDANDYDRQADTCVEIIKQSGVHAWIDAGYSGHIKLYSLSYFVLGPLVGHNILSAEPVNLGCYLAILILIFKIAKELFDQAAARTAAAAVAIWPSFLLHNTQVLKDPICVTAMLALVLVLTMWLTRELSWRMALLTGLIGSGAVWVIYVTRVGFWGYVMLGLVLIAAAFLVLREVGQRSFFPGNMFSMLIVLILPAAGMFLNPALVQPEQYVALRPETKQIAASNQNAAVTTEDSQTKSNGSLAAVAPNQENQTSASPRDSSNAKSEVAAVGQTSPAPSSSSSPPAKRDRLIVPIQLVRNSFAYKFADSGTLIDSDVQFFTVMDLVRYLPRAVEIGFLAPFPNTWLGRGKEVGRSGRLLSGAETVVLYVLEMLALFGVWRGRRRLSTWLLVSIVLFGVTTVAIGVINVGALYRLRYSFFLLLIVLGMHGLTQTFHSIRDRSFVRAGQF